MKEETLNLKIVSIYDTIVSKVYEIYDVFKDYYKEENVDLQELLSFDSYYIQLNNLDIFSILSFSCLKEALGQPINNSSINKIFNSHFKDLSNINKYKILNYNYTIERLQDILFNNSKIIIHFPSVRITNEYGEYIDIKHLWVKVKLNLKGILNGTFSLNRSEYTNIEMQKDYMHSHIADIPFNNFSKFQTPCLGEGPIKNTCCSLNNNFDIDLWKLFCFELDKYVHTESVSGIPYHHLNSIKTINTVIDESIFKVYNIKPNIIYFLGVNATKDFINYFINKKVLKFNYINNSYSVGLSFVEYLVLISNIFIEWYNNYINEHYIDNYHQLIQKNVLKECYIKDNIIYYKKEIEFQNRNYSEYQNAYICNFKGNAIKLNIVNTIIKDDNPWYIVLNYKIALYILNLILKVLNIKYGKTGNIIDKEIIYF